MTIKKIKLTTYFALTLAFVLINSCAEDVQEDIIQIIDSDGDTVPDEEDECPNYAGLVELNGCPQDPVDSDGFSVNRKNQQALNVVYFIPSDKDKTDDVINLKIDQISTMMLYIQSWYLKQMQHLGYGDKTFGLFTNEANEVKIHVIKGENPSSYYGGNSARVRTEVKAYFESLPELNISEHTMVLGDDNSKIGFEGGNKWGFATASDFSLIELDMYFDDFKLSWSTKLGGIMHELGHGLNLPHNCQKASDAPMVALMSYGNHEYSKDPSKVFLTRSSGAILDTNVLFNKITNGISYYETNPNIELESFSIQKNNTTNVLKISGSYISDTEILYNYLGFDFVNAGSSPPNDNYDEITYSKNTIKDNEGIYSFEFEVPYSDFFNGYQTQNKDEAYIELNLVAENGIKKIGFTHYFTIDLAVETPNDDILVQYEKFDFSDRSNWTITANTSSTEGGDQRMIDGDRNTYWHSLWPYVIANRGSHEIIIDMGVSKDINGMYFLSERSGAQWRPKHLIIESSPDSVIWNTANSTYINSVNDAKELKINLSEYNSNVRYLKVIVDQIYTSGNNTSAQNLIFNEIDIY